MWIYNPSNPDPCYPDIVHWPEIAGPVVLLDHGILLNSMLSTSELGDLKIYLVH